jgi:ferritin
MKLSAKLEKSLNDQINLELTSAYAYLGMAAYFEGTPFTGFAAWMRVQTGEEVGHAGRIFKYIVERGGKVKLGAIPEPKCEYRSPLEVFKASLGHEQKVSAAICAIYEQATAEKDYATLSFLKWFLDEQVEEERNATEILARLELAGDNRGALYQLDSQAGSRAAAKKG